MHDKSPCVAHTLWLVSCTRTLRPLSTLTCCLPATACSWSIGVRLRSLLLSYHDTVPHMATAFAVSL